MKILLFAVTLLCFIAPAQAMTVREAYDATRHRQTPFNPERANMSLEDSAFLEQFFNLTDLAMRDRVQAQRQVTGKKDGIGIAEYNKRHAAIIKSIGALKASENTGPVRDLVVAALEDQKNVLNIWAKGKKKGKAEISTKDGTLSMVEGAHDKLVQAYLLLLKTYTYEEAQNRQAFHDYLSSLDFKG